RPQRQRTHPAAPRDPRPVPLAGQRPRARQRDRACDGGVQRQPDPPRAPAPAPLRDAPRGPRQHRPGDARPHARGGGAGADPARPPGVRRQARRGRAAPRALAPHALSQAQPLRDHVMPPIAIAGAAGYAVLASWYDVRTRRIPNRLSGAALVGALVVSETAGGIGLRAALAGLALGAAIMLPPFALGAVGGGDLKFTAVAGAWLGPRLGLRASLVGPALGLVVALAAAAAAGRAGEALSGAARLAWLLAASLSFTHVLREGHSPSRLAPIPYALPL